MGSATGNTPNSNAATYYYYDGQDMIQEGTSALSATRIYVPGPGVDQIAASQVVSTGEWRFHHYDGQGNCILLTDTGGNIREQYDYDAFGMPYVYSAGGVTLTASQWGNRFLFTGREWLSDLRIYDYRARQYQPELGRFLQPDPKEFSAGDYNLYRYCHNDPVNHSDPDGTERITSDKIWEMAKEGDSANNEQGTSTDQMANAGKAARTAQAFSLLDDPKDSAREAARNEHLRDKGPFGELTKSEAIFLAVTGIIRGELREAAAARGLAAETTVVQGARVYRVWGDGSPAAGPSWTTVDPRTVASYRNVAGLPNDNSGRFLSAGSLQNTQGVTLRAADPLHGNVGGLPELRIPNPASQIRLENVQGLNPEF
jgi:RHS repeat-associated protein